MHAGGILLHGTGLAASGGPEQDADQQDEDDADKHAVKDVVTRRAREVEAEEAVCGANTQDQRAEVEMDLA